MQNYDNFNIKQNIYFILHKIAQTINAPLAHYSRFFSIKKRGC